MSTTESLEAAERAIVAGDDETLGRLLAAFRANPEARQWFGGNHNPHAIREGDAFLDARTLILREHHFDRWPKFLAYKEALADERSPVAKFEAAVDAVVAGDVHALEGSLHESSELVRARSTRLHRATLLHYVGGINGGEGFRQVCTKNAEEVAGILLKAGAEVDAVGEMYARDTALGLIATSIHPLRAGVQIALIEKLLEFGAAIDGVSGGGSTVNSCLANGRKEASEFLAGRGARLDLEGAAGVGRLELVKQFFHEDGSLKANASRRQMHNAFEWACEYGRANVIRFLLDRGLDVETQNNGLHWAIVTGNLDSVQLFLARNVSLEMRNRCGGTALGAAIWGARNNDHGIDYVPIIEALISAGANLDADPRLREHVGRVLGGSSEES